MYSSTQKSEYINELVRHLLNFELREAGKSCQGKLCMQFRVLLVRLLRSRLIKKYCVIGWEIERSDKHRQKRVERKKEIREWGGRRGGLEYVISIHYARNVQEKNDECSIDNAVTQFNTKTITTATLNKQHIHKPFILSVVRVRFVRMCILRFYQSLWAWRAIAIRSV